MFIASYQIVDLKAEIWSFLGSLITINTRRFSHMISTHVFWLQDLRLGPPVTAFLGNISKQVSSFLVNELLAACGPVLSWNSYCEFQVDLKCQNFAV